MNFERPDSNMEDRETNKFETHQDTDKKINQSHEELNQSIKSGRSIKSNRHDDSSIEGFLEKQNVKI